MMYGIAPSGAVLRADEILDIHPRPAGNRDALERHLGRGEGLIPLMGYVSVIAIIFIVPQAAFGYVGAFIGKYAAARAGFRSE